MDPHASRADLNRKRRHYAAKLAEAGHSDTGRTIPMARLVAVDETEEKARAVAKRVAEWTVASYVGPQHSGNVRQGPPRDFGGKDPIDFYLDDVMIHGTAESVVDQIQSLALGAWHELPDGCSAQWPFVPAIDRQGAAAYRRVKRAPAATNCAPHFMAFVPCLNA